jgi:hypothetical protein
MMFKEITWGAIGNDLVSHFRGSFRNTVARFCVAENTEVDLPAIRCRGRSPKSGNGYGLGSIAVAIAP